MFIYFCYQLAWELLVAPHGNQNMDPHRFPQVLPSQPPGGTDIQPAHEHPIASLAIHRQPCGHGTGDHFFRVLADYLQNYEVTRGKVKMAL